MSYMMARGRFPRHLCTHRASLDPTALTDPLLDPLPGLSSRSPRCSSSRTRAWSWRPSRPSQPLIGQRQQARQRALACPHTSAPARCTLRRRPCVPMRPHPRVADRVVARCVRAGAKTAPARSTRRMRRTRRPQPAATQRRRVCCAAPPCISRRRCYELFRRTPISLAAGVRGGTAGPDSAVRDGRKLAAATEAPRDDALIFFLLQRVHICIVNVSIVSITVLDVVFNTLLMRPKKRCCGDDFKAVRYVTSPVTDTK